MFSKLTSITSARCANSSTECGERTNRSESPDDSSDTRCNAKLHQRAFPYPANRLKPSVKSSDFLTRENST